MASGFAQHYLECTTCDGNAEYHCNTCQFDLCQTCKETHQRKKKTENHEVVLYKDRNEKVEEMCSIHNDKTYDACCKECEMPVCIKCIKESHSAHAIVEIEDIFNEKLKVFNKQVQELKEKIIPQCEDVQKDLNREMEKCKQSLIQIRSDLLATAQTIKDMVDVVLQEKIERLRKIEDNLKQELECHETELETYTKSLNSIIEEFEVVRKTEKKAEFIMKHKEKLQIHQLQTLTNTYYTPAPSFTPRYVSKEKIEGLIGDIVEKPKRHLPGTTELHRLVAKARCNFEIARTSKEVGHINVSGVETVCHIAFQDENAFWVNDGSGYIRQVDMQGQTLYRIKTASNGEGIHAVTAQGVLYIAANKHNIYLSDKKGERKDFISVKDWEPTSVYKSRLNGDVFVGMIKRCTARVTRHSESGKVLHHIQYSEEEVGKSPNPHFIAENKNGDVIMTSNADGNLVVVVVDSAGRYRFSYTGNPKNSMESPWAVVTDILKNILICDYNNRKIHIINEDGMFLAYIDVNKWGNPSAIDIDHEHNVWIGFFHSGTIRKFRYLQEHD